VKLRDFVGKARQRILHTLFGRNLYAADERVKELELSVAALEQHWHYEVVAARLKERMQRGLPLRVCFFINYDSSFTSKPLFEKMLEDKSFAPRIVVIPDVSRGRENMLKQLQKAVQTFQNIYGVEKIRIGYDGEQDQFIDISGEFDLVCFTTPYDEMTHRYFQLDYLKNREILPFFILYATESASWIKHIAESPEVNFFWKIFVNYPATLECYRQFQQIKGRNVAVVGNIRMDEWVKISSTPHQRKRIIIAPHHTIEKNWKGVFTLSNFLDYSGFFLELPSRYPEIDFIFRPHPLLFIALKKVWGEQKTGEWLTKFLANPNTEYSEGGEFLELFANSDAIIHDCGSFILDYLYTGNACCFMTKSDEQTRQNTNELGQECLEHYYRAYKKEDILNFIDQVVLTGKDPLKEGRIQFVETKLKLNYPHAADVALREIKMLGGS
jgi:hypothetical protein